MNVGKVRLELRVLAESVRARLKRAGDPTAVERVVTWAGRQMERIEKQFRQRVSKKQVHPVPHKRNLGPSTAGLWRKLEEELQKGRREIDAIILRRQLKA
jgi:hypothetical protein